MEGEQCNLLKGLRGEERIFNDLEVLVSAPRRTAMAFTEYILKHVYHSPCIAEHGSYD